MIDTLGELIQHPRFRSVFRSGSTNWNAYAQSPDDPNSYRWGGANTAEAAIRMALGMETARRERVRARTRILPEDE